MQPICFSIFVLRKQDEQQKMTVTEWIDECAGKNKETFSYVEVRRAVRPNSDNELKEHLADLCKKKILLTAHKNFFVIAPPSYQEGKPIAYTSYIQPLMAFLKRPFYIGMQSAVNLLGFSHEAPERFSVFTLLPKTICYPEVTQPINWIYRATVPESHLIKLEKDGATLFCSDPELTALDIVQYGRYVGDLNLVIESLKDIIPHCDFSTAAEDLFKYSSIAAIQRLGYLLEHILFDQERADVLYDQFRHYAHRPNVILLDSVSSKKDGAENKRWKICVNI